MRFLLLFALYACITDARVFNNRRRRAETTTSTDKVWANHPPQLSCEYLQDEADVPAPTAELRCFTTVPDTTVTLTLRHKGVYSPGSFCWMAGRPYYRIETVNSEYTSTQFTCSDNHWLITLKPVSPEHEVFALLILVWGCLLVKHVATRYRMHRVHVPLDYHPIWSCLTPWLALSYWGVGLLFGKGVSMHPEFTQWFFTISIVLDLFNDAIFGKPLPP